MGDVQNSPAIGDRSSGRLPDLRWARSPHAVVALHERRVDRHGQTGSTLRVRVTETAVIVQPDRVEISVEARRAADQLTTTVASAAAPCRLRLVPSLAQPLERPQNIVPQAPAAQPIENYFEVTNLGTLLDALA